MNSIKKTSLALVPYMNRGNLIEQSCLYVQEECLKTRTRNVVEDSLKTQFRDYKHFHQYGMGDIVVLVGTSTAGKTSIIKALKGLEPDRLEDGCDLRYDFAHLKIMTKHNLNEVRVLGEFMKEPLDISKAVDSRERSWKTGVSLEQIGEAEEAIERIKIRTNAFSLEEEEEARNSYDNVELEMFNDAFELSRSGRNVIFDALDINVFAQHVLNRDFDGPIRNILIYCPFHILSSRMEIRNKEANETGELSNQRIGEFPLTQFSELYTQKGTRQITFERLTRSQVTQTFDENYDKRVEADRKRVEADRKSGKKLPSDTQLLIHKKILRAECLTKLGFRNGIDEVEVAPKNQRLYHLILDSSRLPPTASAEIIHRGTYHRY